MSHIKDEAIRIHNEHLKCSYHKQQDQTGPDPSTSLSGQIPDGETGNPKPTINIKESLFMVGVAPPDSLLETGDLKIETPVLMDYAELCLTVGDLGFRNFLNPFFDPKIELVEIQCTDGSGLIIEKHPQIEGSEDNESGTVVQDRGL